MSGAEKRVYPHLLRHSFATHQLPRGMNPIQLADILGAGAPVRLTCRYPMFRNGVTLAGRERSRRREVRGYRLGAVRLRPADPWRIVSATAMGIAVLILAVGCGASLLRRQPSALYTVTTMMMIAPGKHSLIACHIMPLPLPPIGCGGVEVRGIDPFQLPGTRRFPNGTVQTATFRLVGRWDGSALVLTEPPQPPQAEPMTQAASHPQAEATQRALAAQQRVLADWDELRRQGIQILELSTDGDSVTFLVAVADRRTIQILQQRYGPVEVTGWLQPV